MLSKRLLFLSKLSDSQGRRTAIKRTARRADKIRKPGSCRCALETLEDRLLLSATPVATPTFINNGRVSAPGTASPTISKAVQPDQVAPLEPDQMEAAYGVNLITFGSIQGTGKGQTIAIVDAYNDPTIVTDADSFSSEFGLPQFNGSGQPTLQVLNENGGTNLSQVPDSSPGGWDVEESLDVEWAHSMAPQANIILFEANSNGDDLYTAEATAADTAGVSAVSNSWSSGEYSQELQLDSIFKTPTGHQGVTFLASTGDDGTPAGYPAYSPNVVAVGGTSLYIDESGSYLGESGWSGSGGGISQYETQPAFQAGAVNGTSTQFRTAPDISLDADPDTGVYVLDSYAGGWYSVGGTSLSCPMMAGLIADANQGRVLNGLTTLNGATQTLPALYTLSSADFHDETTGNNGLQAGPGYDLVTGIGSPVANDLVTALADYQSSPPATVSAPLTANALENGQLQFSGASINVTDAAASSTSDSLSLAVSDGTLELGSTAGLSFVSGGNGASSMTVTGTLSSINTALNGLTYTPFAGYVGSDFLQVSAYDAKDGQTGWATINLTVNPATAPIVSVPSLVATSKNHSYSFSGSVVVADSAASGASDSLSLWVDNGDLALGSTTGLTFTSGHNNSTSMTVNGTLANLEAALVGLVYTPNSGFTGSDWLQVSVDNSHDFLSDSATTVISVMPTPSVVAPQSATVIENASYTFSGTAIELEDPAASGTSDSLTLSAADGSLTLASTSGLTIGSGANGSSSITVTGTLANLNAAVQGLVYAPNTGFLGADSLQISLDDSGNGETASSSVAISVVARPSVTAPGYASVTENSSYTFNGSIVLADLSAATGSDSLALSVADGKLTLASTTGITVNSGANGSSSMTVTGTLANLNAAVNGLIYAPKTAYVGSDGLIISYKDLGDNQTASNTVAITINALGAPIISAPTAATTNEDVSYTFSAGSISVTDAGASGSSDSLAISVADGKLTLGSTSGLTFSSGSNGSSSMTATGTLANLNAALGGLVYVPNSGYFGSDSLSISVNDPLDSLTGKSSVALTINPVPTVSVPAVADVTGNTPFTFPGGLISVTDPSASGTSDSLMLSVADGTLTLGSTTGLTFGPGSNGSSSMTITGTLANLNAAVNGLIYTPTSGYTGPDSLQISLKDSGDNVNAAASVAITVGTFPPPGVAAPSTATLNENGSFTFSGTISATDTVAAGTSDSLTLSVTNGKLTLGSTTGLLFGTGSNGASSMTVTGTLANLNAALVGLVYTPTSGYSGHDSLKISVNDSNDDQSSSGTVAIAVDPFATAPATASILENSTYAFSSSGSDPIALTDGASAGVSESLTLTVLHGKLTLASTAGLTFTAGSNGSSSMTVKGTLANLNAALNGLVYAPQTNYTGSDTLSISFADSLDNLSGSASVALTIAFKKILAPVPALANAAVMPAEQDPDATQWAGVTAAVELLNG